jgi:hypothetical protein
MAFIGVDGFLPRLKQGYHPELHLLSEALVMSREIAWKAVCQAILQNFVYRLQKM